MNSLTLSLPIEIPSAQRVEELIRESAREVAREEGAWFDLDRAAEYLGVSEREFRKLRTTLGIPVAEISERLKRVYRPDLDAVIAARLVITGPNVIEFPSIALRTAALASPQKGAA